MELPMAAVTQLGFLEFGVSNLDSWKQFATQILGLKLTNLDIPKSFGLKMDKRPQRFFIHEDPTDDLKAIGLEANSIEDFNVLVTAIRKTSTAVKSHSPDSAKQRGYLHRASFKDPTGIPMELVCSPLSEETPFESDVVKTGFVADELGLGHLVVNSVDQVATHQFYTEILGFRLSDHIRCEIFGYPVDIEFLHANSRHHSIAIGGAQNKKMHHFMLEVKNMDEVGLAYDRCIRHGLRIMQTLGKHPNDGMFSFYAKTPSGFQFEFGFGGKIIDDDTWTPKVYDRVSDWGHHPPEFVNSKIKPKAKIS